MSGADSPNPSPFDPPSGASSGPALPPPNQGRDVPAGSQPGPYPGAPPSAYGPVGHYGPAPGPSPAGTTGDVRDGRDGRGGGVPLVVWFLLGTFMLGGALAAFFLTRGGDEADEPDRSATVTVPTAGTDETAQSDTTVGTTNAPTTTVAATPAPVTTNAEPSEPTNDSESANEPEPTDSVESASADSASADSASSDPEPPASPANAEPLADGTYTVGTDIEPGVYRVGFELESEFDTYSFTIFDAQGFLSDLEIGIGEWSLMLVPDETGATVELTGGAIPIEATGPVDPNDHGAGTYLVGYDIEPGTYELSGDSVSFERFDSEMHGIADASAGTGETLELTIKPSDFAVQIEGQLTPIG